MLKPLKKNINNKSSSTNIIELKNIFESDLSFNDCFTFVREFKKNMIPKKGRYNVVITSKSLPSSDFLNLFEEIENIYLFATKLDEKRKNQFKDNWRKITLITDDAIGEQNEFKKTIICATHVKAILIETKKEYISILGSGNPAYNARIEQYFIFNDKDIFFKFKNDLC